MTKASGQCVPAFDTQQGGDGVAQGSESLRRITGANCGAVLTKADIPWIVGDIFDRPVVTAQLFNLVQSNALAVEAGDEVLDRNRFLLGAVFDGGTGAAYYLPHIDKGQVVIEGWRTLECMCLRTPMSVMVHGNGFVLPELGLTRAFGGQD